MSDPSSEAMARLNRAAGWVCRVVGIAAVVFGLGEAVIGLTALSQLNPGGLVWLLGALIAIGGGTTFYSMGSNDLRRAKRRRVHRPATNES